MFLQGTGDVLISYENEAINVERQGKPVEHINPPQTFKIENPVAVVTSSTHLDQANALKNFLYTRRARISGIRPASGPSTRRSPRISRTTSRRRRSCGPSGPGRMERRDPALFDKENGTVTKIYKQATG